MKNRLMCFLVVLVAIRIVLIPYPCKAEMKVGFDLQQGSDHMLPSAWQSNHCFNRVHRLSIRAETRSLLPTPWALQGELFYARHKADEVPDYGQDTGFNEIGFALILKRYFFDNIFYAGVLVGISHVQDFPKFERRESWSEGDQNSNIGHSHYLGSFGVLAGRDWPIYSAWSLRTELRLTHTSDPFRPDLGKNYGAMVVGVSYAF